MPCWGNGGIFCTVSQHANFKIKEERTSSKAYWKSQDDSSSTFPAFWPHTTTCHCYAPLLGPHASCEVQSQDSWLCSKRRLLWNDWLLWGQVSQTTWALTQWRTLEAQFSVLKSQNPGKANHLRGLTPKKEKKETASVCPGRRKQGHVCLLIFAKPCGSDPIQRMSCVSVLTLEVHILKLEW